MGLSHSKNCNFLIIFLEFYKCYILNVAIDIIYHLQKLDWRSCMVILYKVFSAIFSRDASCSNYFTPKCLQRLVNDFKHILCLKKASEKVAPLITGFARNLLLNGIMTVIKCHLHIFQYKKCFMSENSFV